MSEIIILTGAYGVGKSEFASQLVLLKAPCVLADFDVINPYFRPREQAQWLLKQNVRVIGSNLKLDNNQDMPALSGEIQGAIFNQETLIIDCAGSENGLKPLASFINLLQDAQVWLVVNAKRTESLIDQIKPMIELFETRSHLKISGLVHNTHLLDETTAEMIICAQNDLVDLALELKIPIVYTMLNRKFYDACITQINNPVLGFDRLILREQWMKGDTL
ncbi:MAG: hypothetical protein WCI62_02405 [Erysipelotrichaceae bacterium]